MDNQLEDKKVRIITHSNLRFEGNLYQINAEEKTIALKNVKNFGTEDRNVEKFVPPNNLVYEFIVFRSTEIQNLIVLNDTEESNKGNPEKTEPQSQNDNEKKQEIEQAPQKIKGGRNFDHDSMMEKVQQIESQKQDQIHQDQNYMKDDFFDNLSTSINKNQYQDPYHNTATTKQTFGYVPNRNKGRGQRRNFQKQGKNNYEKALYYKKKEPETCEYVKKNQIII